MTGILTLNAGSSSMKFGLYRDAADPVELLHGQIDGIGTAARLILTTSKGTTATKVAAMTQGDALTRVIEALAGPLADLTITGVGHRIVHGGPQFSAPVILTQDVLAALSDLGPLAPLHQPHNLAAVAVARQAFPNAVQIGCFDTAFHRGHPWVNDTFAIPPPLLRRGNPAVRVSRAEL